MNWFIIALFSVFGAIMGTLSIKGYTQKLEPFLWLLFAFITALVLSKSIGNRSFFHAFLIGVAWGVLNGLIQFSFFDQYLSNNPRVQEDFKKSTAIGLKPRYLLLVTGPVIGAVTGAVMGGLTLLLKKMW
jgi:hypothetical protein